jgi:ligand-binding SRPBCC domain-containing protein
VETNIVRTNAVQISRHPQKRGAYLLFTEQWFPHPVETVFPFFADASNLEAITPPWLHFEVLTPRPFEMAVRCLIDYKLRLHGIPIKWKTEISVWEPPFRFVDRQLKGPYRLWVHEHTFEAYNGGTRVIDRVEYQVLGGALINALLVRRDLERIFQFRRDVLSQRFS